jgi:hypothetical protein
MSITSYTRISRRGWNYPTSGATIGPSNDHTDGTWIETDLYNREIGINTNNGVLQYVASGSVYTVLNSISSGATPNGFIKNETTGTTRNVKYKYFELGGRDFTLNPINFTITNLDIDGKQVVDILSAGLTIFSDSGNVCITEQFNNPNLNVRFRLSNNPPNLVRLDVFTTAAVPIYQTWGTFFAGETINSTSVNRGYIWITYLS